MTSRPPWDSGHQSLVVARGWRQPAGVGSVPALSRRPRPLPSVPAPRRARLGLSCSRHPSPRPRPPLHPVRCSPRPSSRPSAAAPGGEAASPARVTQTRASGGGPGAERLRGAHRQGRDVDQEGAPRGPCPQHRDSRAGGSLGAVSRLRAPPSPANALQQPSGSLRWGRRGPFLNGVRAGHPRLGGARGPGAGPAPASPGPAGRPPSPAPPHPLWAGAVAGPGE